MKHGLTYASTNSANATIAVSTRPCLFGGAVIGGGIGQMSIYNGTALVMVLANSVANGACPIVLPLPLAFTSGINMTQSGTGACCIFYALAS